MEGPPAWRVQLLVDYTRTASSVLFLGKEEGEGAGKGTEGRGKWGDWRLPIINISSRASKKMCFS